MDLNQAISNSGMLCSFGQSILGSTYSLLWSIVTYLGFWKCLLIIITVFLWSAWEIYAKNTHHYNSENGFTPTFNRFIGASTYFLLQTFTYLTLEYIFSSAIYYFGWPYFLHLTVFFSTGLFLHAVRFWPYWKIFGYKIRIW